MIQGHDDRRGHQHAPVAIDREEGERAEDVEMRLDPAAAQVDEQGAHEHLGGRDDVSRRGLAGPGPGQEHRQA